MHHNVQLTRSADAARLCCTRFGFFSVGMFVSQSYMYGPDSPLGFAMVSGAERACAPFSTRPPSV